VKLALQDFYCISIPISATVELSPVHHLAQLHCQDYSPEDMQNYISETKMIKNIKKEINIVQLQLQ
jgi:hypothetical protein